MEEFDWQNCLHKLHHYLPSQSPLKDFIHHNTLHGFQHYEFFTGIGTARKWFGYQVYIALSEYREKYSQGQISIETIRKTIEQYAPNTDVDFWENQMLTGKFPLENKPTVGELRDRWKFQKGIDFDVFIQPVLFQVLGAFLDQGVSSWNFPHADLPFWTAVQELERSSVIRLFKTKTARKMLFDNSLRTETLLFLLLGSDTLFEQYVFDQQFSHAGWSGLVATIESKPETLLKKRNIQLEDIIKLQLLLEMDFLDWKLEGNWQPMNQWVDEKYIASPFQKFEPTNLDHVLMLWQRAFEMSYYSEVLSAIQNRSLEPVSSNSSSIPRKVAASKSFQAMFCIDDRECSIRRHLEATDSNCETFGTPGFFNLEFYFKPENSNFITKHCPAPVNPKYLIKEYQSNQKHSNDIHFNSTSHSLLGGWIIAQFVGLWSALKLVKGIFFPTMDSNSASSLKHLGETADLTIEHRGEFEGDLQVGYTLQEMLDRASGILQSIGLVEYFAPIVYVVGHGSSTTNNPHYAAYDCGACSGRPGSVNARVLATILNRSDVRNHLLTKGISIPSETVFIGALHDTTRDDIVYYTKELPLNWNSQLHQKNTSVFNTALKLNAKERSRRFELISTRIPPHVAHKKVKLRSVSVFEPRPELNHATNALCIIGNREFTENIFLDRRAFLNSYDWKLDSKGDALYGIIRAAAPVCGGINLEYYFSRVDNNALGAGSKLPHNVVGLFGVANGIAGDLRTGLPSQMIEVHDPVRLLIVVEQFPETVQNVIERDNATLEWFSNQWVNLAVFHPVNKCFYWFDGSGFIPYQWTIQNTPHLQLDKRFFESSMDNLPVVIYN